MNPTSETFYSNGKLLLTGEYLVLDGALALALPTKLGQSLTIEEIDQPKIIWKSYDSNGFIWFEDEFKIIEFAFPFLHESRDETKSNPITNTLMKILFHVGRLKDIAFFNSYINTDRGFKITTKLDFPINWGLGSSSTLINNIASWTNLDAYELLSKTFGGSGYDIACAKHQSPITYQLLDRKREISEVNFNPEFKKNLFFVYLNKKQNSREGIAQYKSKKNNYSREIARISEITSEIVRCKTLGAFEGLLDEHEQIIANIIEQKTIKELLFGDFEGSIKSLGAWGGDFVMVTSRENPSDYFKSRGFETIITYSELIK